MNFQSWCFPSFDKKETVSSFLLNIFAFVVCGIFWWVWYDFLHFFITISKLPINSFIYIWSTAATVKALSFGITLVELWRKKTADSIKCNEITEGILLQTKCKRSFRCKMRKLIFIQFDQSSFRLHDRNVSQRTRCLINIIYFILRIHSLVINKRDNKKKRFLLTHIVLIPLSWFNRFHAIIVRC